MTVTESAIIDFARQWDPQPFHVDAEFAKGWTFGGLIASGLHTMSITLRLWLDQGILRACSLGSPGLGEVTFPRPVRPGDTLRVATEVVQLRQSSSKPDRGIIRIRQATLNQRDERSDAPGDDDLPETPLARDVRGIVSWRSADLQVGS